MAVDISRQASDVELRARAARVMGRIGMLAAHTEEPGWITRPYGSAALRAAMDDVAQWMASAGLDVRRDAIGNLRGRLGAEVPEVPEVPALMLGSHLDSVRNAGAFDGPLGVLVALDALERLNRTCRKLPVPLELVVFSDEEGMRFQTAYLGSRALAGAFDDAMFDLRDEGGVTLREAVRTFGGDPAAVRECALRPGEARAYLEVHIEQGPVLESRDVPLGVVTDIAGQSRVAVRFTGEAGHAGTVPPRLRHDALPAAAECVLAAERAGREIPGLVATVGQLAVEPGVSNVIPAQARFTLDVRHADDAVRRGTVADLVAFASGVAAARSLELDWRVAQEVDSVHCASALVERLSAAVAACGYPVVRLASGAGHDAVMMRRVMPVAMLFVRCRGGVSHHPDEFVREDDVAAALAVLDHFLASLAAELAA